MNDKARLGAGDVEITLAGKPVVLKPTWECCQTLSKASGGLALLQQKVSLLDLDAIALTVSAGAGIKLDDDLREDVYRSGLYSLFIPAGSFISNVSNGGKPLISVPEDQPAPQDEA